MIKLWSPHNVAFAAATHSVTLPNPEIGNSLSKGRNQKIVRTRAGNVKIYDRGNNKNELHSLKFQRIRQTVIDTLIIFLGNVSWGSTRLKYEDWEGNTFVVRVTSEDLKLEDQGRTNHLELDSVRVHSFDLELLDITSPTDLLILVGPDGIASAEVFGTPTRS